MHRLSIIIAATDDQIHLEDTLVSVLEHRPDDCEVVVVHDGAYEDPYDLSATEIRLVAVDRKQSWIERVVTGCNLATSDVVHVLGCGAIAEENWTQRALQHFVDVRIGSVVPVIASRDEPDRVESVGVVYRGYGWRRLLAAGRKMGKLRAKRLRPVGPSLRGGFYRREAILAAADHLELLGDRFADVDVGLSLRAAGYKTVVELASRIYDLQQTTGDESAFCRGRKNERLFWRSAGKLGWKKSLAMHPLSLLIDAVRIAVRLEGFWHLCGRLSACFELIRYRNHYRQVAKIAFPAAGEAAPTAVAMGQAGSDILKYDRRPADENGIGAEVVPASRIAG